jgi:hypothetical protein
MVKTTKYLCIILSITFISFSLFASTDINPSKSTGNKNKRKKSLPLYVGWKNRINSNINLRTAIQEKNIYSTGLKVGTKLKKKIKRGVYLIDLPSADILLAQGSQNTLREYNITNTLIGLYIATRKHIFTFSNTIGYSQNLSLDGKDQIQKNRFAHIALDVSYDWTTTQYFKLGISIGTKLREYSTKADTSSNIEEENDDWKQFLNIKGTFTPKKGFTIGPSLKMAQKLNKEKRSSTLTGAQGGELAQGSRQYKFGSFANLKLNNISIGAKIDSLINKDLAHGAQDYNGLNYEVSSKVIYGQFTYSIKAQLKNKQYETQLIDVNLTPSKFGLYKSQSLNITNTLTLPKAWFKNANIDIEHKFQKLNTNRSINDEDYKNQVLQLAVNFTY